jgi:hypothetical protein
MSEEGTAGALGAEGTPGGEGAAGAAGAGTPPSWLSGVDADLVSDPFLAKFTKDEDLPLLIKEAVHAQRLIGKKGLIMPGRDASPEEVEAFQLALGRPKEETGYEFGKPADWPEDLPYEQAIEDGFRSFAFKAGLSAKDASAIFKWYTAFSLDQVHAYQEAQKAATEAGVKELRKDWGPEYEQNFKAAGGILVKYGGEALAARQDLQNDPDLVRFLFKVAQVTGEDAFIQGGPGGAGGSLDEMITDIDTKMKAMVDKGEGGDGNPEYVALRERRKRLYEQRDQRNKPKK